MRKEDDMNDSSLVQSWRTQPLSLGLAAYRMLTLQSVTEQQQTKLVSVALSCDNPRLSLWLLEDIYGLSTKDRGHLLKHIATCADRATAGRALRTLRDFGTYRAEIEARATLQ
jgi:hypothetical protein